MSVSTSTSAGPYIFSNYGPMTTTFTPPASCVTGTSMVHIAHSDELELASYAADCPDNRIYTTDTNCYPGLTTDLPIASNLKPYYSPGLHCYDGWKTVGMAVKGDETLVSTSGPFAPDLSGFVLAPLLFRELLKPSETAVLCCPSSMTFNHIGYCASVLEDYPISTGCSWPVDPSDYSLAETVITLYNTTRTLAWASMAESAVRSPVTTTLSPSEASSYVALTVIPMVTMIHPPTDKGSDNTSDESGGDNESDEGSEGGEGNAGSRLDMSGIGSALSLSFAISLLFGLFIL